MAEIKGDWVTFTGGYACRVADISHVYTFGEGTRILLRGGGDFTVPETFEKVLEVIAKEIKDV